ncbi:MAG TPA: IscS subfamily cysteine desulfurase [Bacillota bacterium]|nr:IscS subfamily cysteine desulfurase [Bacillota bacterium]
MKYFDYAASTPLDEKAASAYVKAATEYYGNSSSLHDIGDAAHELLENCRSGFAQLFNVPKEGIYFTSGGSEANYLGIQALLSASPKTGKHIISSMAEHSSVRNSMEKVKQFGYEVTFIPFNKDGQIDVEDVKKAIRTDTILISIQHGNPEIGTLQPVEEVSQLCRDHDILLHSDCVQSFGKVDITKVVQSVDSFTISAHKFHGPKGVGLAFVHPRLRWDPYIPGTTHEYGFRPGTVNVPAIASMFVAAQQAIEQLEHTRQHVKRLYQGFMQELEPIKDQCIVYPSDLLSTIGMRIKGLEGQVMMLECNRHGFAISTGSACQVSKQSSSKTMMAMGVTGKKAKEFIRISFGKDTEDNDVKQLVKTIVMIVRESHIEYASSPMAKND